MIIDYFGDYCDLPWVQAAFEYLVYAVVAGATSGAAYSLLFGMKDSSK